MPFKKYVLNSPVSVSYSLAKGRQKNIVLDIENSVITVNWSKETAANVEKADAFTTLTAPDINATMLAAIENLYDLIFTKVVEKEGLPPGTFQ